MDRRTVGAAALGFWWVACGGPVSPPGAEPPPPPRADASAPVRDAPAAPKDAALPPDAAAVDAAPPPPDAPVAGRVDAAAPGSDAAPAAGWWDPAWRRRRPVTVANPGNEDLVDFPLAVMVAPMPAGDLRVVDAAGTVLAHEIEGNAVLWVRLPRLRAGASGTAFWLYDDNPAAPPAAPAGVWTAPHAAVWHFSGDARDATGNRNDGVRTEVRFVPGMLGQAAAFDFARKEHVSLAPSSRMVSGAAGVTVSMWVQHQGQVHDGQDIIIGIGTASASGHLSRVSIAISPDLGLIGEANPDEGAWDVTSSAAASVPNGQWHYLTAVIDVRGRSIQLYKNGAALGGPFRGRWTAAAFAASAANRITIGCEEDESKSFFNGLIDELRVEAVARPPAWIAAQARAAAGKMAIVGAAESPGSP
jgi:hypothetical protein